jgi:hypothetical protein
MFGLVKAITQKFAHHFEPTKKGQPFRAASSV